MNEQHLYNDEYFMSRVDPRRRIAYEMDAQKIKSRQSGSVLDIGCGTGEFGEFFEQYHGYDPFTHTDGLYGKYDVVIFRGTLQHIYNPIETLATAKGLLNNGGLLAILATPDTDSIGYVRWGTLPALDAPRNWIPFGHRMLTNILERLGFVDIEIKHPYEKPYASPLKNIYNFIVGKPDAFLGNMMEVYCRKALNV